MFSIIIPLYNKAPYIEKAIQSVLAQTLQDFELIVIDDGSTDNSYEIVQHLFSSLTPPPGGWGAFTQQNQGVSTARNNGVKLAKNPYICFLDADDWWAPTFLEEMKALIDEFPNAGIYGSSYFKVKNGKHIPANIGVEPCFEKGLINYFQVYAKTMWMPLTSISVAIPKGIFDELHGFKSQLKLGEDFDLWMRIAVKYPVAYVNKPLVFYNQDVEQTLRGVVDNKIYPPDTHFIFNLDFLSKEEKQNVDLKYLLDKLRVYTLFRYRMQEAYSEEFKNEINKVDFRKQPLRVMFQHKMPLGIVRKYYILKRTVRNLIK